MDLCTDAFQDWNTASLAKFQPLLSTVTKSFGISLYFKKLIDLGLRWIPAPMERRRLCPDYPPPLIDLDEGRARALAAFEDARARAVSRRSGR